ncbi:MAG: transcriptional regulator [Spirulina sp. SIO3F2]|nr:transcriptional regulator [Spirulina sp. SIO3F2]
MSEAKDEKAAVPPAVQQVFNGPVYGVAGQAETQTVNVGTEHLAEPACIPTNLPLNQARVFVGRGADLENLHQQLQATERVAISAVSGMGGVGKTELALQYAHKYLDNYGGGVVWLRGEQAGVELLSFARSQFFPNIDFTQFGDLKEQLAYCFRRWYPDQAPPKPVLLIFDDVNNYREQVVQWLSSEPRFRVLLTTRERIQGIERLDLDVLEPEDALALLGAIVGEARVTAEPEAATALCQWLGFLPLGIELAGYYVCEEECTLSELLAELQQREAKRTALEHPAMVQPEPTMTAQRGVEATFELSWERLDIDARFLGAYLSLFAAAPIRWELVVAPGEVSDGAQDALKVARRKLVRFSLLKRNGELIQYHPLIKQFFLTQLESDEFVIPPSHQLTGATTEILRLFGAPE